MPLTTPVAKMSPLALRREAARAEAAADRAERAGLPGIVLNETRRAADCYAELNRRGVVVWERVRYGARTGAVHVFALSVSGGPVAACTGRPVKGGVRRDGAETTCARCR